MALNLEDKKRVVSEVAAVAANAYSAVAAEYRGMTVEQLTDLRRKARDGGVYLRVVKNTLARRALQGTDFECINDDLVGPLVLAFSQEDPGAAARVLKDFTKSNDKLVVKFLAIGGQKLAASELEPQRGARQTDSYRGCNPGSETGCRLRSRVLIRVY